MKYNLKKEEQQNTLNNYKKLIELFLHQMLLYNLEHNII